MFKLIKSIDSSSYSNLLKDISSGDVISISLNANKRYVLVKYNNNESRTVPVLINDQNIIRLSQANNIPLTVIDTSRDEAIVSTYATFSVVLLFIIFLSIILRKSLSIANQNFKFLVGNSTFRNSSDINERFEDIAGMPEAILEVKEIVKFLKNPKLYTNLGARIPKGFLLVGPPGTGKTLLARTIAGEAGVPFISISASEFIQLFVGLGSNRIRMIFEQAQKKKPCIIFIDEIDSIGRQRGYGIGGGNDEREQTLNQLLTELDGFKENSGIIVLAATNRYDTLDSALTRPGRFDRKVHLSLPNQNGRLAILSIHARSKPLGDDVSLIEWASKTAGFTGAELANLLNEAAICAAKDKQCLISSKHLNKSIDRITLGISKSQINNAAYNRLIAYNQIGIAVLAQEINFSDEIDSISILRRGFSPNGSTRFVNNDNQTSDQLFTKSYLYSKLLVTLAGRATELLVYGDKEISQISAEQLKQATVLAKKMVVEYGFTKFGLISLQNNSSKYNLGRELLRTKSNQSNVTNKNIDSELNSLINKAFSTAKTILKPYLNIIDLLSNELIYEETISGKHFKMLLNSYIHLKQV